MSHCSSIILRFSFFLLLLSTGTASAQAQDEHLKMQFDFSNTSGTNVTDATSGITAKLMGQAQVVTMGQYHVLDLGNGTGYLDMTRSAGELVRSLGDFTVSVYYRVDAGASLSGAGYFLWCFSQSAANTQTASPYTAYRLNAQRMATSTGGWGSETGMEVGSESEKGRWMHVLYRQTGKKGELFLNGKCVAQLATMPVLKDVFTAVPAYNWIGRPPFSGDSYLKQTLVTDFRLYDTAVSNEEVAQLVAELPNLEYAYEHGGGG
ncbi:MAG: laminin G, partial [Bacteroidaceae bacterium]|nr:laminin G [Bacteroidaceae bacterium]